MVNDTIAAIATAPGEGGVAILRISGELSEEIMRSAFRPARGYRHGKIESHRMYYGHAVDENGNHLDEVMAVLMRAPKSYTREDVAEISCHGGRASIRRILKRVLSLGARSALPGEFTRRAFENGRIDLTQAEAVMRLISAGSEAAQRAGMRQLEGGVSGFVKACRSALLALMARIEAANDFPEEIDELAEAREAASEATKIAVQLRGRADAKAARIVREGVSVVLAGKPNVGKSSLMNAMLGSERAIVTEIAGTTRDVLTESMTLDGIQYTLSDTAGRRETGDVVEAIGVKRAEDAAKSADVVVLVLDAARALDEEDMRLMDLLPDAGGSIPSVHYQYRTGDRYIHLKRNSKGRIVFAFFHIEIQNSDGIIHTLAGQIVTNPGYEWTDGIEPVLLELLGGLTVELS